MEAKGRSQACVSAGERKRDCRAYGDRMRGGKRQVMSE